MHKLTFLALCGSLRHASYNRSALQALKRLSGNTADINLHSLGNLPLFNPDTENDNIPSVEAFKSSLKEADGLIISSPEYAHGISGVMKNALDWLVSTEAFVNIPIMLINTSPRATHAQQMLNGLQPQLYQLVHLHYLEGFSMHEIGDLLSIPAGTIKSRLHQARKLIQHNLATNQSGDIV